MKAALTACTMPLLLLAALTVLPARAQHHHQAPGATQATSKPAQRWATDAPLRAGMAKIRTAVDVLQHHEHGHMDPVQVVAVATQIQQQIAYMIANCKLEPQADAALHLIIAPLAAGAQALKSRPADLGAVPAMRTRCSSTPASSTIPPGRLTRRKKRTEPSPKRPLRTARLRRTSGRRGVTSCPRSITFRAVVSPHQMALHRFSEQRAFRCSPFGMVIRSLAGPSSGIHH